MHTKRRLFAAVLLACASASPAAAGETLRVGYNERPPYHYSVADGAPKGLVADIVVKALDGAGLKVAYVGMETNRIMSELQSNQYFCSFSWFRTDERAKFAKFTHAVWQDEPFIVVAKKENEQRIRRHKTLAEVFDDAELRFGTRKGTAYNEYVERCARNAKAEVVEPSNTQAAMVKMLAANRFSFLILVPTEVKALFAEAGVDPAAFALISFPEMPPGGKRRIMCSKQVPDDVLRRIDASLEKIVPPRVLE